MSVICPRSFRCPFGPLLSCKAQASLRRPDIERASRSPGAVWGASHGPIRVALATTLWGRGSFCAHFADGVSEVRVASLRHTDSMCQNWGGNLGGSLPRWQSWEERLALGSRKMSLFSQTTS